MVRNKGFSAVPDLVQSVDLDGTRDSLLRMLVRALYPFRSTSANELSIHATQRLALIEGGYNSQTGACWGDCGWVRVATLDGLREGYVPAGYVVLDKDDDVARQLRLNAQREAEREEFLRAQGQHEALAAQAAAKERTPS